MRYNDGRLELAVTDLAMGGFGATWGHTRVYNNQIGTNFNYGNGWNWMVPQWAYVVEGSLGDIGVVRSPRTTVWFEPDGLDYLPKYGAAYALAHTGDVFLLKVPSGDVWEFHDLDQTSNPKGALKSFTTAGGQVLMVNSYALDGVPASVSRTDTASDITETFVYGFTGPVLTSITLQRQEGSDPAVDIRKVEYTYYGASEANGLPGDLRTAVQLQFNGSSWEAVATNYYRYYKTSADPGFPHGLKFVLGPDAFARLSTAEDPFTASDATVEGYADLYLKYGDQQRVVSETVAGGTREYSFEYVDRTYVPPDVPPPPDAEDYNEWKRRTVETRPDGSQVVVFTNFLGQVLLRSLESGSDQWIEGQMFDDQGHMIAQATPAAIESYTYVNDHSPVDVVVRPEDGLIHLREYFHATDPVAGEAKNYPSKELVQKGELGPPITLRKFKYDTETAGGVTIHPIREQTVYRDTAEADPIVTQWEYTYHSGTTQILQRKTIWPVVLTAQNGSNAATEQHELYDEHGYLIATQDERGYINTYEYDVVKGVMLKQILDDDAPTGSGWTPPGAPRLKHTSDFEYDEVGRQTQSLGPEHDVNGVNVRTASWTVYDDFNRYVMTAQGYHAVSADTDTLVNPVSISISDENGRQTDAIQSTRDDTSGRLTIADETELLTRSHWVRWTHQDYNDADQLDFTRVYFDIPSSGDGDATDNYNQTSYGYDDMGRQNSVTSPAGTITYTNFDVRDQALEIGIGTTFPTDMQLVTTNEYDDGLPGGNGNLTKTTQPVDGNSANDRVTSFEYDFRDRQIWITGDEHFFQESFYDNLDQVYQVDQRDTDESGTLLARSETKFDNRGRVYQAKRYAVSSGGTPGNALIDNTWYDAAGNVVKSLPSGALLFTKMAYDGLGRVTGQYQGYYNFSGSESYSQASQVNSANTIYSQTLWTYDDASNVTLIQDFQRLLITSGGGPLDDPTGSAPLARTSYQAMWYDGVGRSIATANYGTNANAGIPTRPDSPPASTATVLVSTIEYNARGEAEVATDPEETATASQYDDAGRLVGTVQNVGGLELTTTMTYHSSGQLATLTAENAQTGAQVTTYTYGTTLTDSEIASNDLLASALYPTNVDPVSYLYNRQQQRNKLTDQNGTVHEYDYDNLGRQTIDRVATLGTNGGASIDGAVRRIEQTFNVRGLLTHVTSYDATTTVINDVEFVYNDFNQLGTEYQAHGGATSGSSPKVQYAYANGSANTTRLTDITYPNGTVKNFDYGAANSVSDRLSRVAQLNWSSTAVCAYTYFGLNSFIRADYVEPDIRWDLITGSGANPYAGLDRFGRVIDCLWRKYSATAADLVRLTYGYNRDSSRLWREETLAPSGGFDELYTYDAVQRLMAMDRGDLNGGHTAITTPTLQQAWDLDPTGNWNEFDQSVVGTLIQFRTSSELNQITDITESGGSTAWTTPAYDRSGNMTSMPQPAALNSSYTAVYDAWNRMVSTAAGATTVATYAYDGLNRRTIKNTYTGGSLTETRHYYFSNQWQVLEERVGASTSPNIQYVWGIRYVDDLVLRDRDTGGGTLNQRLYAMQDANWNVVAIASTSAAVQERYAYQPYGVCAFLDSTFGSLAASAFAWNYLFTGRENDVETGLQYNRYRYLHQYLGNWLTLDPIKFKAMDANLYRYVGSLPTGRVDPSGELVVFIWGGGESPLNGDPNNPTQYPLYSWADRKYFADENPLQVAQWIFSKVMRDGKQCEPVVIVGHSLGGPVAATIARVLGGRSGKFPGFGIRVQLLATLDPIPSPPIAAANTVIYLPQPNIVKAGNVDLGWNWRQTVDLPNGASMTNADMEIVNATAPDGHVLGHRDLDDDVAIARKIKDKSDEIHRAWGF